MFLLGLAAVMLATTTPEICRITFIEGEATISDPYHAKPYGVTDAWFASHKFVSLRGKFNVTVNEGTTLLGRVGVNWFRVGGPAVIGPSNVYRFSRKRLPRNLRGDDSEGTEPQTVHTSRLSVLSTKKEHDNLFLIGGQPFCLAWQVSGGAKVKSIDVYIDGTKVKTVLPTTPTDDSGIGWVSDADLGKAFTALAQASRNLPAKVVVTAESNEQVVLRGYLASPEMADLERIKLADLQACLKLDSWLDDSDCVCNWLDALTAVEDTEPQYGGFLIAIAHQKLAGFEWPEEAFKTASRLSETTPKSKTK